MDLLIILHALSARDLLGLLDSICSRRGVSREELCGRGRTQPVARARHELWWSLRHHPQHHFTYQEIGRIFGRNHSSILHGVRGFQRAQRELLAPRSRASLGWLR